MFCDFILIDINTYECNTCGTRLISTDGGVPIFICNKKISQSEDEPSFLQKIKNFTQSSIEHIAGGLRYAKEETILQRYSICKTCEFFKNETCSKCGCPLFAHKKYISKLSWADQKCPVGKWDKEST